MRKAPDIRSTQQWFQTLKEPVQTQAIANATNKLDSLHRHLYHALSMSFDFKNSPEGEEYWENILNQLPDYVETPEI